MMRHYNVRTALHNYLLLCIIKTKLTQRAQTSLVKAAHYLHIARIPDLESQHGDQDHPKYLINCFFFISSQDFSENFCQNLPIFVFINCRISNWIDSDHHQRFNQYVFYCNGPLQKISFQSIHNFLSNGLVSNCS